MVHPLAGANRLAITMTNFGAFLNLWQQTPLIRIRGTALTQFRSVRRGGGDRGHSAEFDDKQETKRTEEREENDQQSSSSAHSSRFSSSTDAEQIRREFNAEFRRFLSQSVFTKDQKAGENFEERMKEFMRDFNKRITEFEVEAVPAKERANLRNVIMSGLALGILGLYIVYRVMSRDSWLPEHRAIVAQQAISFDQFTQDYLAAGEVQMVFFYPAKSIAIAILHQGAVIRGQPFNGYGVLVRLDPHTEVYNFLQLFEDAQNRLGIDPRDHVPVAIQLPSMLPLISLFIGWFLLMFVFFNYSRAALRKSLFHVKRKGGKAVEGEK